MSDIGTTTADQPGAAADAMVQTYAGSGQDGREALSRLLAELVVPGGPSADDEAGEIAVPFQASGASLAEVTTAVVAAVLEQQETHALATARVDLDGWLATEDGVQAWGLLSGIPDAASSRPARGDVIGAPSIEEGTAGVTITIRLGALGGRGGQ